MKLLQCLISVFRESNPEIRDFMKKMSFDPRKLENFYFANLFNKIKEVTSKNLKLYVWQEVFDDRVEVVLIFDTSFLMGMS